MTTQNALKAQTKVFLYLGALRFGDLFRGLLCERLTSADITKQCAAG